MAISCRVMQIGISLTSAHAVADVRLGAQVMIERTAAAREAGLDSLFVGDHHATARPYYQNNAILGRLLAEWGEAPAGALYLLPLWHPVLLAEQVGTLASIARGRFVMQCAIGGGAEQFDAFGASLRTRVGAFEECLDLMRALWRGDTVSSDGHWTIRDTRIAPVPPEPVEVWVGAQAPRAIERAARLADGFLAGPGLLLGEATEQATRYREGCARHDRPGRLAIRRDLYVGESDEEARATAGPVVEAGYRGFRPEALVIGGVESVAEELRAFGAAGYRDVIVRNLVSSQPHALASIERLARVRELVADA